MKDLNFVLFSSNFFSFSVVCSSSGSLSSWHPGSGGCSGLSVKKKCLHVIDNSLSLSLFYSCHLSARLESLLLTVE